MKITKETTEEMITVMQAFVEGKQIQVELKICGGGHHWMDVNTPTWEWNHYNYRIKPENSEPRCRPYKNDEEMIADITRRWPESAIQHHSGFSGVWLKYKLSPTVCRRITEYSCSGIMCGSDWCNYENAFKNYTFMDDSPFGIKE